MGDNGGQQSLLNIQLIGLILGLISMASLIPIKLTQLDTSQKALEPDRQQKPSLIGCKLDQVLMEY